MATYFELSIVIPVFNEEVELLETVQSLRQQQGVLFEVIVADGGSTDATCEQLSGIELPVAIVKSARGIACQLNRGATLARGEFILFLHADSRFPDINALRKSLDLLRLQQGDAAGHFQIRFRDYGDSEAACYEWLEMKAAIDRVGCAHGDQGVLVAAGLFRASGGFDEHCQIMAATRFADRMRQEGRWLLLPAEISSSARRFVEEGFRERLLLNMAIMALASAGAEDIVARMPDIYQSQDRSCRLHLPPFFRRISSLIAAMKPLERAEFWSKIGRYVCENVWQAALWLDWRFTGGRGRFYRIYSSYLHRFGQNRFTVRLAALASRIWLYRMTR